MKVCRAVAADLLLQRHCVVAVGNHCHRLDLGIDIADVEQQQHHTLGHVDPGNSLVADAVPAERSWDHDTHLGHVAGS